MLTDTCERLRTWISVPDPDPENLDRLVTALDSLEATLPTAGDRPVHRGWRRRSHSPRRQRHRQTTKFGGLDIVQLAEGVPAYSQLDQDAVESDLLGTFPCECAPLLAFAR